MKSQPIPFYTPSSLIELNNILQSHFKVLEFGSGNSTLWYSTRVEELISVEHNQTWYNKINSSLKNKGCTNVQYNLHKRPYNNLATNFTDEYFDLIIIDGRDRVKCIKSSMPKLKKGGYLIFDNSDRLKRYEEGIKLLNDWEHTHYKCPNPKEYTNESNWWTTIYKKPQ